VLEAATGTAWHRGVSRFPPARVERFEAFEFQGVIISSRAVLRCGCTILIPDDLSAAGGSTLARACMSPHARIIARAIELLGSRPAEPETVAAALTEAQDQLRPQEG
jgi:hypothetical protein